MRDKYMQTRMCERKRVKAKSEIKRADRGGVELLLQCTLG